MRPKYNTKILSSPSQNGIDMSMSLHQTLDIDCPFCHRYIRYPLEAEDYTYYEAYKKMEKMFENLISELNELMQFCEYNYGMNPAKESIIQMLNDLRKKFLEGGGNE